MENNAEYFVIKPPPFYFYNTANIEFARDKAYVSQWFIKFSISTLEKKNIKLLKNEMSHIIMIAINESCKNFNPIFEDIDIIPVYNSLSIIFKKYGYDINDIKTSDFEIILSNYIKKYFPNKNESVYKCILEFICYSIEINKNMKIKYLINKLKNEILNNL